MPVPPIYQPEVAAEAIHWIAHSRRRQIYVGIPTVMNVLGERIRSRGCSTSISARPAISSQQTDQPLDPTGSRQPLRADRRGSRRARPVRRPGARATRRRPWLSRHRGAVGGSLAGAAARRRRCEAAPPVNRLARGAVAGAAGATAWALAEPILARAFSHDLLRRPPRRAPADDGVASGPLVGVAAHTALGAGWEWRSPPPGRRRRPRAARRRRPRISPPGPGWRLPIASLPAAATGSWPPLLVTNRVFAQSVAARSCSTPRFPGCSTTYESADASTGREPLLSSGAVGRPGKTRLTRPSARPPAGVRSRSGPAPSGGA